MEYVKAFLIGGGICVIGQILIDKTKLSSPKILVVFVVAGCILGGLGLYQPFVDFAGAGATVPLPGFGNVLAQGAIKEVKESGFVGIFVGGLKAAAGGITAAIFFSVLGGMIFEAKEK